MQCKNKMSECKTRNKEEEGNKIIRVCNVCEAWQGRYHIGVRACKSKFVSEKKLSESLV